MSTTTAPTTTNPPGYISGSAKIGMALSGSLYAIGHSGFPIMGVKYYVPVTVNYAQVSETDTNFLYQWDLSSYLSDAGFKAEISGSQNITVYDPVTMFLKPKVVKLNLTNDKLFVYHDGPKSSTVNKVFYICVGAGVNVVDSVSAFTNSGITNFWGMDEFVNGATVTDSVGGVTGTVVPSASIGNTGAFGNAATFTDGTGLTSVITTNLSGNIYPCTIECLFRASSFLRSGRVISCGGYPSSKGWILYVTGAGTFYYYTPAGGAVNGGSIALDTTYYMMITVTDATPSVVTTRLNGTVATGNVTRSATFGNIRIGNDYEGGGARFVGWIDQPSIYNTVKSSNYAADRRKLLTAPAAFATLGNITEQETYTHIKIVSSGALSAIGSTTGNTEISIVSSGALNAKGYISGSAKIGLNSSGAVSIKGIIYGNTGIVLTSTGSRTALGYFSGTVSIVLTASGGIAGILSGSGGSRISLIAEGVLSAFRYIKGNGYIGIKSSGYTGYNETGNVHLVRLERRYRNNLIEVRDREITC
jgi:hypothetical protein